jgi:hypothetical protein
MHERRFERTIRLSDEGGSALPAALVCAARYWSEDGFSHRRCVIALRCDRCEVAGEGPDFFDAFCRVREALAAHGLVPLCYGASRNVYPSNMARDMGDGLKAYRMRPGCPAAREDLVAIFNEGPGVEPASVEEQRECWKAWLRSLGLTLRAEPGAAAGGGRDPGLS